MAVTNLTCRECGATYDLTAQYVCGRCFGPLEVKYDHTALEGDPAGVRRRIQSGPQNIWRYADFLPLATPPAAAGRRSTQVGLPAGCTPLIRADRLADALGLNEVWVKNDAHNPTHSFKDRVVAVAAARARELGFDTLACASTGNLANAVAAAAAALGMPSYVFIPADLEEQKILATGEQPSAWAPFIVGTSPSSSPTSIQSEKPLAIFVYSDPEAIGTTHQSGISQPSCSAISKATVFEPSA